MNNFTKAKMMMISVVIGLSLFVYSFSGPLLEMIDTGLLEPSINQLIAVEQETVTNEGNWTTAIEVANKQ